MDVDGEHCDVKVSDLQQVIECQRETISYLREQLKAKDEEWLMEVERKTKENDRLRERVSELVFQSAMQSNESSLVVHTQGGSTQSGRSNIMKSKRAASPRPLQMIDRSGYSSSEAASEFLSNELKRLRVSIPTPS